MTQLTKNSDRDLFEILVAVAWLDGEIQPEEKKLLEKIAREQNLTESGSIDKLLSSNRATSSNKCYQLLQAYLGDNPSLEDYQNLLAAVSSLIYSDDDIANEEAALLTQMQSLDPQNTTSPSALDKAIAKIQQMYRAGVGSA